jgi:pyruvate/2-oxoglutarate dehydrogenase complex dihydrolipoamide dehydrogenase (E3) component
VVGGSATGCQLATIFDTFVAQVAILEVAPGILAREDSLVSQTMEEAFRRRGIRVIAGIGGVERIEKSGSQQTLWYTKKGKLIHNRRSRDPGYRWPSNAIVEPSARRSN